MSADGDGTASSMLNLALNILHEPQIFSVNLLGQLAFLGACSSLHGQGLVLFS